MSPQKKTTNNRQQPLLYHAFKKNAIVIFAFFEIFFRKTLFMGNSPIFFKKITEKGCISFPNVLYCPYIKMKGEG